MATIRSRPSCDFALRPAAAVVALALTLVTILPAQAIPAQAIPARAGVIPVTFAPAEAGPDIPAAPRSIQDAPAKHGMPMVPAAVGGRELRPGPECRPVEPSAVTGGGVTVYRNTPVQVGSRATVGEPSAAHNGAAGLMTGNWYAATSGNDGQTWSYVNPYTKFPASDGGFCCDQYTHFVAHKNAVFWLLQYSYSASTQSGRHRIAVLVGPSNLANANAANYYDISPQTLGFAAGTWFDFPHMASTAQWLYIANNVFDSGNGYVGSAVVRMNLDDMVNGRNAGANWWTNLGGFAYRFAAGFGPQQTRMHWASHQTSDTLRIHWADDGGGVNHVDRTISTWYWGTTNVAGPDGRSWTGRADNRIQGGYDNSVHVGFLWYSNAGGSFPKGHVRAAWFDHDGLALAGEHAIWSSDLAWAYPSVAVNVAGHLGGTMAYGGGTYHPGTVAWIVDANNCWSGWENLSVAGGTHGPDGNKWGDYLTSQCDPLQPLTWLATAMSQIGGSDNAHQVPRNVDFGRPGAASNFRPLDVESAPVSGVPITVSFHDNYCRTDGTTPFHRVYPWGLPVLLTAPATAGARQFYRWVLDGVPQTIGALALPVTVSNSNNTARAEYGFFTPGTGSAFGQGCLGRSIAATGAPLIGNGLRFDLVGGLPFFTALLNLGFSRTSWNGVPLPLTLPGTSCRIYTDMAVSLVARFNPVGVAFVDLSLPSDPALIGGHFYTQFLDLNPGQPQGFTLSNALDFRVGGWVLN